MNRWQAITPLLLGLALGCSADKKPPISSAPPPTQSAEASGNSATSIAEHHPDHIARRPDTQHQVVTPKVTTDLPLWPPPVPAAPLQPQISPPNPVPPPPAQPGVPWAPPFPVAPADQPPQPFAPALPTVDPPQAGPALSDPNPLRGSSPELPTAVPRIPVDPPVPASPATNPLRSADVTPLLPTAPAPVGPAAPSNPALSRWNQMNAPQTAPAPIESGAPAAPISTLPQLPKPLTIGPSRIAPKTVPLLPHAPADVAPTKPDNQPPSRPAPQGIRIVDSPMIGSKPSGLPKISVYSSAPRAGAAPKRSAMAELAMMPSALLPESHNPSGGAAPTELAMQPRMMTMGARKVEAPEPAPAAAAPTETAPLPPAAADPPFASLPFVAGSPPPSPDQPLSAAPPFPLAPESTPGASEPLFPGATSGEGSAAATNPTVTAPEATLPPFAVLAPSSPADDQESAQIEPPLPAIDEPFEIVRVFYGTDRRPILINEDTLLSRIIRFLPAVALLALAGVGIGVVIASRKISWIIGTSALIFLGAVATWHGISETLAIASQAALEEVKYSEDKSDGGRIERGICEVSIPESHKPGELEGPSAFLFEKFDPEEHIMLRKTTRLHDEAFYEQIRQQVANSPDREILVFIHGFNVSFEDAARRTAQMAKDLEMKGAPVFYSWPADKYFLLTYGKDETSVGWSAPHLKEFLLDLVHHTDAKAINLVAHSMGNRAMTTALREIDLQLRDESRLFNQVVLAAPDIDADDFRDNIAPAIQRTARQVTLYASKNDVALSASRFLHRNPRAGDTSRGLVIVPGIHTIDVSNINGGPWGHSYYGASDPVLRDLNLLLTSLPPERRTWLKMNELDGQTYWAFKPLGTARGSARVEPR